MLIGVPREIKVQEHRVGLVPESVRELVAQGHQVLVERDAHLLAGLNVHRGQVTHPAVAASLGLEYVDPRTALARS